LAVEPETNRDLFLFGTLRDPELLSLVAGRDASQLQAEAAIADDRIALRIRNEDYPVLVERKGAVAEGLLLVNVDPQAYERLYFFENVFGYDLYDIQVRTSDGLRTAKVFLTDDPAIASDEPWDVAVWRRSSHDVSLEAAAEIMSIFEQRSPYNTPIDPARVLERADSKIRAKRQVIQNVIKDSLSDEDVRVESLARPYSKFFAVEDYVLSHRTFGGGWSKPVHRTAFVSADAVTVLPYDPVLDKVVLIEQFRIGAYARGDRRPWLLEVVAGRCDSGQTPEAVVRREAEEEAGLTLRELEPVAQYYVSPGAYNEYIYSYIGRVDLSGYNEGVHGLGSENEDIATHLLDVDRLLPLVASGEANNTPLIISILWLALNRERLQKEWTGA
jgi:nudix-type nucleoside diphosphatase (YffH/AdpP family)